MKEKVNKDKSMDNQTFPRLLWKLYHKANILSYNLPFLWKKLFFTLIVHYNKKKLLAVYIKPNKTYMVQASIKNLKTPIIKTQIIK